MGGRQKGQERFHRRTGRHVVGVTGTPRTDLETDRTDVSETSTTFEDVGRNTSTGAAAKSKTAKKSKDLRKQVLGDTKEGRKPRGRGGKGIQAMRGAKVRGTMGLKANGIKGFSKSVRSRKRQPWDDFTVTATDQDDLRRLKRAFGGDIYDIGSKDDDDEAYFAMAGDEQMIGDKFIHLRRKMSLTSLYSPDKRLQQLDEMAKKYKEDVATEIEENKNELSMF